MTLTSTPPILLQFQNAESLSSQITILRALKNETIGHDQRKETLITWGIIPILSKILALRQPSGKVVAGAELNGSTKSRRLSGARSEEDEACLQAIIVVGSLAQGTSFPSYAGRVSARRPHWCAMAKHG